MNTLLFAQKTNIYLTERWLQNKKDNSGTVLLTSYESLGWAKDLQKKYPFIEEMVICPDEIDSENSEDRSLKVRIEQIGINKVILPYSVLNTKLFFIENTTFPDIKPLYQIIRRLWRLGLRNFEIYNLNGSQSFSIPHLMDELKDKHRGKRCFVVGNGPSLNNIDMSYLKDEITLGSNRCYLGYKKWGFNFTYWGIEDRLQIEEYQQEYEDNIPQETIKFYPFEYIPFLRFNNYCPYNHQYGVPDFPQFSNRVDKTYLGGTVTYVLIQLAVIMGCNPIILIGADHRFNLDIKVKDMKKPNNVFLTKWMKKHFKGTLPYKVLKKSIQIINSNVMTKVLPSKQKFWTASNAKTSTHFDDKYTKGKRFIIPRPKRAEIAFDYAAEWGRKNGVQIFNATPGTALKSFPLISYDDLFKKIVV